MTIGGGTVSLGSVTTQHATEGTAFSLKDAGTTTSSDPNLTYSASGLPAGLSIDNTGTISGTPGESGQFAVTVHATDAYGTKAFQHFVLDVSKGVTYTTSVSARGGIKNKLSDKCMDVANGLFGRGELVQQYTCGASYNGVKGADQQFQIVTIKGSDNSTKSYLEVISPSGQVFYVTPTAGATNTQLTLDTSRTTADDMVKSGPFYTFPNTGLVADVKGQSKANGAAVIGYQMNGGTNQQWSLP